MAVRIRLTRIGRHKRPYYRLVAADARTPRDGRSLEILGTYDPHTSPPTIQVDREKVQRWVAQGALPTETVRSLLRKCGIRIRRAA